MSEPRDERELTTGLELRTPAWLPGGTLAIHYRRLWDKRADRLISDVVKAADVDEETLFQRVEEGDGFADVFQSAGRRVIENGDPVLRDVLTRLIASALRDDTRIHEVSYMLTKIERFQPIHIRIIVALPPHFVAGQRPLTPANLAKEVNASEVLVESAAGELMRDKFIKYIPGEKIEIEIEGGYFLYDFGLALRDLIDNFR